MTVGVPEADVFAAADRVLERGQRPTVERVRLELGRGSPARVGHLLETWWDALAKRLAGQTRLPALPTTASATFTELWRVAMEEARAVALRELEGQRAAIDAERMQFRADRLRGEQHIHEADQARAAADTARQQVMERLEDLQRLTAQLERQAAEATDRQKSLETQLQAAERERRDLQERLAAQATAAAQARESAAEHVRTVEDRCHAEVDRARQEAKGLRTDMERAERAQHQAIRESQQRESDLRTRLAQEERSASEHAARVRALEEHAARLDGLGDALRSAQEANTASMAREAQLRQALDDLRRQASALSTPTPPEEPRKARIAKTKKPSSR